MPGHGHGLGDAHTHWGGGTHRWGVQREEEHDVVLPQLAPLPLRHLLQQGEVHRDQPPHVVGRWQGGVRRTGVGGFDPLSCWGCA